MPEVVEGPAPASDVTRGSIAWRQFFQHWPPGVPYKGVVVTNQAEQIPFEGFFCTDALLLLDRPTPDTVGARRVILPYENIDAVKITAVTEQNAFESLGFAPPAKPEKPKPERPRRPFMP
jgi:hypothetical protein